MKNKMITYFYKNSTWEDNFSFPFSSKSIDIFNFIPSFIVYTQFIVLVCDIYHYEENSLVTVVVPVVVLVVVPVFVPVIVHFPLISRKHKTNFWNGLKVDTANKNLII